MNTGQDEEPLPSSKLRHVIFHVYDRPAINEHGSRRGTTSFQATELRRRRRRTTEEPIFTRARTEEPKLVDLRIGKRTSTPTIDPSIPTILHEKIRHL
ncbi:hypothetical protein HID58_085726 [Brassica napus]|uniref:Uncharacterized protein n=1 Tax=Brassica napus TaxID=3708 RepID=A0ABQ7XNH7_BRANA|nr:hypothetical protein HID58_085726 [Brassica napus]